MTKTISKFGSDTSNTKSVPDFVDNFSTEEVEEKTDSFTIERLQEDASLQEKLPVPTGYRILILPFVFVLPTIINLCIVLSRLLY